ncbi:MAG TPA: hypothetical protein VFA65_20925 [Bryobacteraceae bacterium]|nr:hypothetical protein [Bryobacteraceae bacterium]
MSPQDHQPSREAGYGKKSRTFGGRSDSLFGMQGTRVLILSGQFEGEEGICLGKDRNGRWAISPDGSDEIVSLLCDREFALLIDLSADPVQN